jgi:hypothetical protein
MTQDEFIASIQDYYGQKYPAGQLPFIKKYLATRNETALTMLFGEILKSFSGQYKTLPDVAIFESVRGDVLDDLKEAKGKQDLARLTIGEEETATPEQLAELFKSLERIGIKLKGATE